MSEQLQPDTKVGAADWMLPTGRLMERSVAFMPVEPGLQRIDVWREKAHP